MPNFMEIDLIFSVRRPVNSCIQWHDVLIIESGYVCTVNNTHDTCNSYKIPLHLFITTVIATVVTVWNMMHCNLILRYRRFGGNFFLHFQIGTEFLYFYLEDRSTCNLRKSGPGTAKYTVSYSPRVSNNTFVTVVRANTLLNAMQTCLLNRIFPFTESTIICT